MANFNNAFDILLDHEGGYVNDPHDAGGETYKGISRVYNKSWEGWNIVDEHKNREGFPKNLEKSTRLDELVRLFYKKHYWDIFQGDDIPTQTVALELFDTGVNMGIDRAVTFLQQSLNILNRNEQSYEDIVEDGKFGPNTFKALNKYLLKESPHYLLKVMNILQGMHYINYMKKSPIQEKYARGWLNRVSIEKF